MNYILKKDIQNLYDCEVSITDLTIEQTSVKQSIKQEAAIKY